VGPNLVRARSILGQELEVNGLDVLHHFSQAAVRLLHGEKPDQVPEGRGLGHRVDVHKRGVLHAAACETWLPGPLRNVRGDDVRGGHVELHILDHVQVLHRIDEHVNRLRAAALRGPRGALVSAFHVPLSADAAAIRLQGAAGVEHLLLDLRSAARHPRLDGELHRLLHPQESLHVEVVVGALHHSHVPEAQRLAAVRDGARPDELIWVHDTWRGACLVQEQAVLLVDAHAQVLVEHRLRVHQAREDLVCHCTGCCVHGTKKLWNLHAIHVATVENRCQGSVRRRDLLKPQLLRVSIHLHDEQLGRVTLRKRDEVLPKDARRVDPRARDVVEERPSVLSATHGDVALDEWVVRGVWGGLRRLDLIMFPVGVRAEGRRLLDWDEIIVALLVSNRADLSSNRRVRNAVCVGSRARAVRQIAHTGGLGVQGPVRAATGGAAIRTALFGRLRRLRQGEAHTGHICHVLLRARLLGKRDRGHHRGSLHGTARAVEPRGADERGDGAEAEHEGNRFLWRAAWLHACECAVNLARGLRLAAHQQLKILVGHHRGEGRQARGERGKATRANETSFSNG